MIHKFKRVHIPTQTIEEIEFSEEKYPELFDRIQFLEMINNWNAIGLLQSKISGKIEWLYIAI